MQVSIANPSIAVATAEDVAIVAMAKQDANEEPKKKRRKMLRRVESTVQQQRASVKLKSGADMTLQRVCV
ncbi:hypothetical protein PC115_g300 [Phytophthora cactorum]|uniref:Uncharacterized protein n=1 Tax=Phytophthora cactorum TaxID=29920 RepID=A0A8T1DUY2_9STRA|nr:hypothetical protein PC115_g300 [Phytophthora cactorum]